MTASRDPTRGALFQAKVQGPWTVAPSPTEIATGRLSAANVALAVEGLEKEGVVLLKGVVDTEHARILREHIMADIELYERDSTSTKIEQGGQGWWHNWQGGRPPPKHPFLFDDICYNESVIAVTQAAVRHLMPPEWDGQLSGSYGLINMAYRGDMVQEVHTDGRAAPIDSMATVEDLPHRTGFSVNIPLLAQTAETGATEYWPGSHSDLGLKHGRADPAGRFPTAAMLAQFETTHGPPKRTFCEVGDLLMRDAMVWHRGTANYSDSHRPMISVGYGADADSSDRHGHGGDGTRRGQGFTAPKNTASFWRKHPQMSYTPVLLDEVDHRLEQRYHGPVWVEALNRYLPGHLA